MPKTPKPAPPPNSTPIRTDDNRRLLGYLDTCGILHIRRGREVDRINLAHVLRSVTLGEPRS